MNCTAEECQEPASLSLSSAQSKAQMSQQPGRAVRDTANGPTADRRGGRCGALGAGSRRDGFQRAAASVIVTFKF